MNPSTLNSYFKSRETILTQLREIGYDTDPHHLSIEECGGYMNFCAVHLHTNARVYVFYELKKITLDDRIETIWTEGTITFDSEPTPFDVTRDTVMFVTQTDPSENIQDQIQTLYLIRGVYVTWHTIERTQFNVLEHTLIPRFSIVPEEPPQAKETEGMDVLEHSRIRSVRELLETFHTTLDNLPTESRFSPPLMAKLVRPGQVVCYLRPSCTAMIAPHWVLCV